MTAPRDPAAIAQAHEDDGLLYVEITEAMRAFAAKSEEIRQRRWDAFGFEGKEQAASPGFWIICRKCGGFASLGATYDRDGYAGASLKCLDCGSKEVY